MSATLVIGIGRALEHHQPRRPRREHVLDTGHVFDRQHGVLDTEPRQQAPDDVARGAVSLDEAEDVIALLRQPDQCLRNGVDARGGGQAVVAALQRRQRQLELARGGVAGPHVEVARGLAAQHAQRFVHRLELVLDALVDRRDDRQVAGRRGGHGRVVDERRLLHVEVHHSSEKGVRVEMRGKLVAPGAQPGRSSGTVITCA